MGRLKSLPSRLSVLPSRVGLLPREEAEAERFKRRDVELEYRAWYKTKDWQDLRLAVLDRDGWVCQRTDVPLIGKYPADNSAVVDHIIPHRGDAKLFWDPDNLQSVSKAYHDGEKQRIERADARL